MQLVVICQTVYRLDIEPLQTVVDGAGVAVAPQPFRLLVSHLCIPQRVRRYAYRVHGHGEGMPFRKQFPLEVFNVFGIMRVGVFEVGHISTCLKQVVAHGLALHRHRPQFLLYLQCLFPCRGVVGTRFPRHEQVVKLHYHPQQFYLHIFLVFPVEDLRRCGILRCQCLRLRPVVARTGQHSKASTLHSLTAILPPGLHGIVEHRVGGSSQLSLAQVAYPFLPHLCQLGKGCHSQFLRSPSHQCDVGRLVVAGIHDMREVDNELTLL